MSSATEVCIANISTAERRKRLRGGVVSSAISLALLGVLMAIGASRWWRIALLPFIMGAASGYFQWSDKT
jgi:hypothetical protein